MSVLSKVVQRTWLTALACLIGATAAVAGPDVKPTPRDRAAPSSLALPARPVVWPSVPRLTLWWHGAQPAGGGQPAQPAQPASPTGTPQEETAAPAEPVPAEPAEPAPAEPAPVLEPSPPPARSAEAAPPPSDADVVAQAEAELEGAGQQEGEVVVVTGSAIERKETTTPAPVSVLDKAELDAAGVVGIGDILQNLPSQHNALNVQFNGSDGSTRVNLRGLGSARTLVLINGRRHVPGGLGANSSVDLSAIPLAVIKRIEVLRDGASAVYGSDAIGAFLNALESIRAVEGKLPVNLMFAVEGEEELGSPHFPEVIDRYEARMRRASGVIFPFNSQDGDGTVSMFLGVKGILYFEMEAKGSDRGGPVGAEIHGSYKAIVDSPALRLVQALAALTSKDGNTITVPGYYDAIRPPSEEEQRVLNGLLVGWAAREPGVRKTVGVKRWIEGWQGRETQLQLLFNTTLNIDGLVAGYTGEGSKTILPHRALAKLDSRLVPDQDPDTQLALIRRHLDSLGFTDIEIRKLSGYPPAQSSVEARLVRATIGVFSKHRFTPSVSPRLAGSAPYYVFTDRLKLPIVAVGLGHGTGAHAPNEIMVVEPAPGSRIAGLAEQEKFYVDLLYAAAEAR